MGCDCGCMTVIARSEIGSGKLYAYECVDCGYIDYVKDKERPMEKIDKKVIDFFYIVRIKTRKGYTENVLNTTFLDDATKKYEEVLKEYSDLYSVWIDKEVTTCELVVTGDKNNEVNSDIEDENYICFCDDNVLVCECKKNKEEEKYEKPPIGIISRTLWLQQRFYGLKQAMLRYLDANLEVNPEWVIEYHELRGEVLGIKESQ